MKTKQEKIDDGIKRLEKLKQETILKYTDEIDFDQDLSLYDVMMNHFVKGDLDSVFNTDVCQGMNDSEKKELFDLTREFIGLCFSNGEVDYWLDSLEDVPISDYNLIAYSIFNSYEFLLGLSKKGGRDVLELLVSLRANKDLRNVPMVTFLSNSFINDDVLSLILIDMVNKDSGYSIFTDEQKGILLNYPEGTLYAYGDNEIKITSPFVLGAYIYNSVNGYDPITQIDENSLNPLFSKLGNFFRSDNFNFYNETMALVNSYRDYVRKNNIVLGTEFSNIIFDSESEHIQNAWVLGDAMLGEAFDTPYSGDRK